MFVLIFDVSNIIFASGIPTLVNILVGLNKTIGLKSELIVPFFI